MSIFNIVTKKGGAWRYSDLEVWLNGSDFYASSSVFSELEKKAIASTKLIAGVYDQLLTDDAVWLCLDYPAADYVFLLSAAEVRELYTEKAQEISRDSLDDGFGLSFTRTIGVGVGKSNEVLATPSGKYFDLIPWNDGPWAGPSPALNVDLPSILFASESGMTKSSALAPVTDMTSNAWKLTLLDGSKTVGGDRRKDRNKSQCVGKNKVYRTIYL